MAREDDLEIEGHFTIPGSELELRATRSSGPGGQHVNTSSTRIELVWDVPSSAVTNEMERARLLERLAPRLDGSGRLRIVAQEARSQLRNREAARRRLAATVAAALVVQRPRKATKPTASSRRERLEEKRHRGAIKRERRRRDDD